MASVQASSSKVKAKVAAAAKKKAADAADRALFSEPSPWKDSSYDDDFSDSD
jgi:hypothetical protein